MNATPNDSSRSELNGTSRTVELLRRAVPAAVSGAVACALVVYMAYNAGGYFPEIHLKAATIALATIAVVLIVRVPGWQVSTPALVALGCLCGLTAWTGLSSLWSSVPDVALEDFQRDLLYVGILGLGLLAAGSGRYSRHLIWAVLAVISIIVIGGLLSRLRPDLVSSTFSGFAGYRLDHPLSYWNAFGVLGVLGVLLGAGLSGDPRSPIFLRCAAAAVVVPMGVAAYLSFSRGAWLAFFVGLAVLIGLGAHRRSQAVALAICGAALFLAIARLSAFPGLTEAPRAGSGRLIEGREMFPSVIVLSLLAAGATLLVSGRWLPEDLRAAGDRITRGMVIAATALAVLGGAGYYLVHASRVEGSTKAALVRAQDWVDRQWDDFMAPAQPATPRSTAQPTTAAGRLTSARGTRSDLYRVAIDGFEAHPLWGDGAGGFEVRFAHERRVTEKVRDAHSLYLETAGELGLPGILLLLGFIGATGWAAVVARRQGGALSSAQSAACASAFAAWVFHAGVDWDWQMPALTGVALLLGAALFPRGRVKRRRRAKHDPFGSPTAANVQTPAGPPRGR